MARSQLEALTQNLFDASVDEEFLDLEVLR